MAPPRSGCPPPLLIGSDLRDATPATLRILRNRDVIAAKLEIEAAQLDVVAARIYPNPQLAYTLANVGAIRDVGHAPGRAGNAAAGSPTPVACSNWPTAPNAGNCDSGTARPSRSVIGPAALG